MLPGTPCKPRLRRRFPTPETGRQRSIGGFPVGVALHHLLEDLRGWRDLGPGRLQDRLPARAGPGGERRAEVAVVGVFGRHGLTAARPWLTVFQLPAYAPELNPVEPVWSNLKRSLANLVKQDIDQLTALVKTRLRQMQYRPGLLEGFLAKPGLDLGNFHN